MPNSFHVTMLAGTYLKKLITIPVHLRFVICFVDRCQKFEEVNFCFTSRKALVLCWYRESPNSADFGANRIHNIGKTALFWNAFLL